MTFFLGVEEQSLSFFFPRAWEERKRKKDRRKKERKKVKERKKERKRKSKTLTDSKLAVKAVTIKYVILSFPSFVTLVLRRSCLSFLSFFLSFSLCFLSLSPSLFSFRFLCHPPFLYASTTRHQMRSCGSFRIGYFRDFQIPTAARRRKEQGKQEEREKRKKERKKEKKKEKIHKRKKEEKERRREKWRKK